MVRGIIAWACLMALLGCSRGPTIHQISGTIKYQGKAVPAGRIEFIPNLAKHQDGIEGFALIKDGKYDTRQLPGRGTTGGAYIVRIRGCDGKPAGEMPYGTPLFEDYEVPIQLDNNDQTRDFEIPVKK